MAKRNDRTVRVTHRFAAAPEAVFDSWLDREKLVRFMAPTEIPIISYEVDPRVGGKYRFVTRMDGREIEHVGAYREITRPRRLVFTFNVPAFSSVETVVTIELEPAGTGTELTLTHEPVLDEFAERTVWGWGSILEKLAGVLAR